MCPLSDYIYGLVLELGTTLTNQNSVQEEIKEQIEVRNACCHSVHNLFSSSLLSKYMKIKIYRVITFPVVLYVRAVWSLTLREEHRLRVFENRVLRKIFGLKRDEVTGELRKLYNGEVSDLYSSPNIVQVIKSKRMRWVVHVACMGERRGDYRGNLRDRDHREDLGTDGRIILRWICRKWDVWVQTGTSWLRIGTGGGHFVNVVMNLRVS